MRVVTVAQPENKEDARIKERIYLKRFFIKISFLREELVASL